jgi:DNA-binding response OmpR family regulator
MRTNGARTCRQLRRRLPDIGIIHVREKGADKRQIEDADVYLELPFTHRKILNRIKQLLPADEATEEIVRYGQITLYRNKRSVDVGGRGEVKLTPKLAALLEEFMRHPHQVVTRRQLMQNVWETDYIGDTRTLDVHIRWMREILEADPGKPQLLQTVRGKGYILAV